MSLPYGFMSASGNRIIVDPEKANIVKTIFQQYLSGMSLGGIADFLFEHGILSPKGKEHWTQPVLSNLLSNQKYIGYIISFDDFFLAQGEKSKRSNINEDTNQRKVTRYNSQSVLSGLLVCAECNHNYRRITRPSGEIVWRCASRVEHGKKFCKHLSAPVRFCHFSPNTECKKMASKGVQPLNNYTCRFRPSSLKCTDKSGLDGLQADK